VLSSASPFDLKETVLREYKRALDAIQDKESSVYKYKEQLYDIRLNQSNKLTDKSKSEFQFSVKAPRLITHYKKFSGTESMLEDFYGTIRSGLKEKLGCVLFQLPPQSTFSLNYLETIVASIDKSFDNVIEFRNADWWNKKVYDLLSSNNISFCGISYPKLPDELIANTENVYYRFHGVPKLYWSSYQHSFLQRVADAACHEKKIKSCYLYFNNTAGMAAIENGKWLNEYLQLECA